MALLRVPVLPQGALAASAEFHARVLPDVLAELASEPGHVTLVFPNADYSHRGWRLAAVQGLAREHAPARLRVNAIESDDEVAIAAAAAYLAGADGVTGQLLPLDGAGAGEVIASAP